LRRKKRTSNRGGGRVVSNEKNCDTSSDSWEGGGEGNFNHLRSASCGGGNYMQRKKASKQWLWNRNETILSPHKEGGGGSGRDRPTPIGLVQKVSERARNAQKREERVWQALKTGQGERRNHRHPKMKGHVTVTKEKKRSIYVRMLAAMERVRANLLLFKGWGRDAGDNRRGTEGGIGLSATGLAKGRYGGRATVVHQVRGGGGEHHKLWKNLRGRKFRRQRKGGRCLMDAKRPPKFSVEHGRKSWGIYSSK